MKLALLLLALLILDCYAHQIKKSYAKYRTELQKNKKKSKKLHGLEQIEAQLKKSLKKGARLHKMGQDDEDGEEEEEEDSIPDISNGIEIETTSLPFVRCTQVVGAEGSYLTNESEDLGDRVPARILANFYNLNVFAGGDDNGDDEGDDDDEEGGVSVDPSKLLASIPWSQVIFPIQSYINGNKCIRVDAFEADEPVGFCFETMDMFTQFGQAIEAIIGCRKGKTPVDPLMDLDGDLEDGLERLAKYYIDENNSTAAAFDAICLDCDH